MEEYTIQPSEISDISYGDTDLHQLYIGKACLQFSWRALLVLREQITQYVEGKIPEDSK